MISRIKVILGCDPEMILIKKGKVIGSRTVVGDGYNGVVPDGVQVELNPPPSHCREILTDNVRAVMHRLFGHTVVRSVGRKLKKAEFDALPDQDKEFGCNPSYNVHTGQASVMELDPEQYLYRSCGGHIHMGRVDNFGNYTPANKVNSVLGKPKTLVPILDIIVGNTLVLIDRDKGNVERRKHYGRAGEYRIQPHGIEYRTVSNFWLRDPALLSLVTGLCRFAVNLAASGKASEVKKLVNMSDIIKAINENDYDLALKNFNKYKKIFTNYGVSEQFVPLATEDGQKKFLWMAKVGIGKFFTTTIIPTWTTNYNKRGWYQFLNTTLTRAYNKENG